MPALTVFTPTFNRGHLLPRVFASLRNQTCKDFEWVVIDDGSTDDTALVVSEMIDVAEFPIIYRFQENHGKPYAINQALDMARGELFVVFDSDDLCTNDAIEVILKSWCDIPPEERSRWGAISCLKSFVDGSVVGEDYRRLPEPATFISRFDKRIRGDKWEILRTDLHKEFRYDLYPGERHMAEEYAWLAIGATHKLKLLNTSLCIVEYLPDGLTADILRHRVGSARNSQRFYARGMKLSRSRRMRLRCSSNFIRFSLHCGALKDVRLATIGLGVPLIVGFGLYVWDKTSLALKGKA